MIRWALSLVLAFLMVSPAYAAKEKAGMNFSASRAQTTSESKTETKAATPAAPVKTDREAMKKKIEEKKAELNGSEWEVDVTSAGTPLGKDTFTFQNQQVTCKTLKDRDYPATNYTVSLLDGSDVTVWETMQTNPKGGVMFIRGEWKEGSMNGVMSEQLADGKTKDFTFASVSKIAVPPTTEKKEEPRAEEPKVEALAAAETTAEAIPAEPAVPTELSETSEQGAEQVAAFNPGTLDEIPERKNP